MFKDRDLLAAYRLLEFPNETVESWPVARRERDERRIGLRPVARDADRSAAAAKDVAA
jgi:hypothetical protein